MWPGDERLFTNSAFVRRGTENQISANKFHTSHWSKFR
jgi:hypothetical protein